MNEILNDIEDLEAVVDAAKNGCGTIRTVQMLDKLIQDKKLEVSKFEEYMLKEVNTGGSS
jgi:hypothetical protein